MPTHKLVMGRGQPLAAVFAALLTGCATREMPADTVGETESGSDSAGTSTSGTSDTTTTVDPTTIDPTTNGPTSATDSASASATGTGSSDTWEESSGECVYADHVIVLTPEQYQMWLDGEGQVPGDTTGTTGIDGTTAADDAGSTAGGEQAGSTAGGEEAGSTAGGEEAGTTSFDESGWSMELCVEICVAFTGASEWDITACGKQPPDAEGNIEIQCEEIVQNCEGRHHACIASRGAVREADPVAAHFARAAHDEAASVYAFAALSDELARLGAPAELLERLRSAAADEVRHARAVSRLAADRGARCRPPARRDFPTRSAREIAVENAVEGCVRETWAALLAAHQAEHAADPQVRAVMRAVAADEARHAELAWAIDAWLHALLDADARAEVAAARARAAADVVASVTATTPAATLVRAAGVPARAPATRLVAGLAAVLWAS